MVLVAPIEVETDETERTALIPNETMRALVFGADENNEQKEAA